jgi:DNA polymerase III sliding clamp (beta) subunit (PCNA family)
MQNKTGDFIKKSKKIHGDKYDYSLSIYTTSKNKLTIICPKHGEFSQRASSHIGKQKQGCKMCANDSCELPTHSKADGMGF